MKPLALAALPALLLAATAAGAQAQGPTGAFKGKVKPGLYETRNEVLLPGAKEPQVSTRQVCLTERDVDTLAEESNPACKTTQFKMAKDTATFKVSCANDQQSMTSDVTIAYSDAGYKMASKVQMTPKGGKPAQVSQTSVSKYIGPCPTAAPAAKK